VGNMVWCGQIVVDGWPCDDDGVVAAAAVVVVAVAELDVGGAEAVAADGAAVAVAAVAAISLVVELEECSDEYAAPVPKINHFFIK